MKKHALYIIQPGTQHAPELATAAAISGEFSRVHLVTGYLIRPTHPLSRLSPFRRRTRVISATVRIHNLLLIETGRALHKKAAQLLGIPGNEIDYVWQIMVNILLFPWILCLARNTRVVLFETSGWPLSQLAQWKGLCVIMDFPSISHELAGALGLPESRLGRFIKARERSHIDFAFFCSRLAQTSYSEKTSSRMDFVHYPGFFLSAVTPPGRPSGNDELRVACIGNNGFRKGIDLLIAAFGSMDPPKRLFLIGHLPKKWVQRSCIAAGIDARNVHLVGQLSPHDLRHWLLTLEIDVHVLASRFDSFGRVVPETMALGIPNIISKRVGCGELLCHPFEVLKTTATNAEGILEQLRYFRSLNTEKRTQFSERVAKKARDFGWEKYDRATKNSFRIINRTEGEK